MQDNSDKSDAVFCCPICCEIKSVEADGCVLTNCFHAQCRDCLRQWFQRIEKTGQVLQPACPMCRVEVSKENTIDILGRPFQATSPINQREMEADDLTRHWLEQNTRPCPCCGISIEKIDGCDKMECRCGYRFCYQCGCFGASCCCSVGHSFLPYNEQVVSPAGAPPTIDSRARDRKQVQYPWREQRCVQVQMDPVEWESIWMM